jgi:hypothetical protein
LSPFAGDGLPPIVPATEIPRIAADAFLIVIVSIPIAAVERRARSYREFGCLNQFRRPLRTNHCGQTI